MLLCVGCWKQCKGTGACPPAKAGFFVMEKPDYSGAFAMFGTRYGSVDTCFRLKGEESYTTVPEGIAHFLEHKLFEGEDGDAFTKYAAAPQNICVSPVQPRRSSR